MTKKKPTDYRSIEASKIKKKLLASAPPTSPQPHQRQIDRSDGGDDDAAAIGRLPTYCRFRDLVEAGITTSWAQILRMVDEEGFPTGIWLSANVRGWDIAEVRRWLASRPTERKVVAPRRNKQQEEQHA